MRVKGGELDVRTGLLAAQSARAKEAAEQQAAAEEQRDEAEQAEQAEEALLGRLRALEAAVSAVGHGIWMLAAKHMSL